MPTIDTPLDIPFAGSSVGEALIETGSFICTDKVTLVPLPFVPQLVIVIPETARRIIWRSDTCWHGRSQHFDAQPSLYAIGPAIGPKHAPYQGRGFTLHDSYNITGDTYHYIAISDNNSSSFKSTSWIGNATNGRAINFLSAIPDFTIIKRDSTLAGQFRATDIANVVSGTFQGGTSSNYTLTATGLTLTNANEVNQNNNSELGEGHECLAFYDSGLLAGDPAIKVRTYTGNGAAARSIPLSHVANAAMIIDCTNDATADTTAHCIVTTSMTTGESKRFTANAIDTGVITSLSSGNLVLDAGFNVSGREYAIISFADAAGDEISEINRRGTRCAIMPRDSGRLEFADVNLSGACTLEWYGRVGQCSDITGRSPTASAGEGRNILTGLLMLGEGVSSTEATKTDEEYNGGIFLACTDPDNNGWRGETIRIVHTDYWSIARAESSINYYSVNTGVIFPYGRDVHLLVRHDGNGHWRVMMDGKLIKDYNVDLDQVTYGNRTNGGAGLDLAVHVNSCNVSDARVQLAEMQLYRASVFDSELSDANANIRINNAILGSGYSGTAPIAEYDYTGSSTPTAVASPNVTHSSQTTQKDLLDVSLFEYGAVALGASTSMTFSSFIPGGAETKKRLFGVMTTDTAAGGVASITSLTVAGVAATAIDGTSAEVDDDLKVSIRWYTCECGPGDAVVVYSVTPTVVSVYAWDISELGEFTLVGSSAKGTSGLTYEAGLSIDEFSALGKGPHLFQMFGRQGGVQTEAPIFGGEVFYDGAYNVGSTSMFQCASGKLGSYGEHRTHIIHGKNGNSQFASSVLALNAEEFIGNTSISLLFCGE